jgi:transposase
MTLRPEPKPARDAARDRLAALTLRRDQLVADRARERGRREALEDPWILADLDAHIVVLDDRIARMDEAIAALIAAQPGLAEDARLLRSVPGFGPVAAAVLLAAMPELGRRSPKAVAALAGLAPINCDSGALRGTRAVRGGRRRVRKALYMAAVAAIRARRGFADAYSALKARGKPAKVALVAIARKLLVTANAILRDKIPFNPKTAP